MSEKIFIGIDTSNYTTSCSFCNLDGEVIKNFKILLPVKEGERGLRQSEAVFAHIKNIPLIAKSIKSEAKKYEILAIGHSAYPRDCEGSYMPCFMVGEAISDFFASFFAIDNFKFSHQTGHVRAAIYSSGAKIDDEFIAFHVSGGTTEILLVKKATDGFKIDLLGGSNDLHAGQAIDRIGVKIGLSFPCGVEMENLAFKNTKPIPKPKISVNGFTCNLSGVENLASKVYTETEDSCLVSAFVLDFIGATLEKVTNNLREKYPKHKIIYAGGVMSNLIIKNRLKNCFDNVYFATPEFSSDNAAGIALLTRENYLNKED